MRAVLAVSILATAAVAAPSREVVPAQLENVEAIASFRAALARQQAGKAERPLRISYIGDSLTADDQITHALRTKLAALVGDGGPGFVFAVEPHPYNQHRALSQIVGGTWRVHGISTRAPADHLLGLGGSAESTGGGAIRIIAKSPIRAVDVHYLAQPRGGALEVLAGGKQVTRVATAADTKRAAFARVALPADARKIELRAEGRVRLFGAALEASRGAVVDNLGIVNATAKQLATHNRAGHWQRQLAHRASDLVIVMLGTNEAEWLRPRSTGMEEHERLVGQLLATIRASRDDGEAACLVISPLDQLDWRAEAMPPRASVPAIVEAQRRAARAAGCAFWDTYAWMGGKGASKAWHRRGLVTRDYQHPTSAGAARIAGALYAALVSGRGVTD